MAPWALASELAASMGWDMEEARTLFTTMGASSGVCFCLLPIWRFLIAPAIPAYRHAGEAERMYLSQSAVSLYPACTAPFLAIVALSQLPVTSNEIIMTTAPSVSALHAVGISCGYMAYDTMFCLYNAPLRSPLIIAHHVFSFVLWPYATLRHRSLILVLFFIVTEASLCQAPGAAHAWCQRRAAGLTIARGPSIATPRRVEMAAATHPSVLRACPSGGA